MGSGDALRNLRDGVSERFDDKLLVCGRQVGMHGQTHHFTRSLLRHRESSLSEPEVREYGLAV